ncbi:MAG: hypothetical protein K8S54_13300 [Spirochaetia bacterium]|nr:hypothetical protein [Spirochaetia bacterium]
MLATVFAGSLLHADSVYLRNGAIVDGEIVNQNKSEIKFRSNAGQVQTIQKTDIARIVYGVQDQKIREEKAKKEQAERLAEYQKQQEAARIANQQRIGEESKRAEADKQNTERKNTAPRGPAIPTALGCVWRSALLPGWGQYACGSTRSAVEVGVLFTGGVAYAAQQNALQRHALRNYDRQSLYGFLVFAQRGVAQTGINYELVKQARGQYHSRLHNYSQSVSILSLIYLGQIAHAYWIGRSGQSVAESSSGYAMDVPISGSMDSQWPGSNTLLSDSRRSHNQLPLEIAFRVKF